jgi:pSer/pThr/pTyr-binding forkhead associated (FHA) protein
MQVSIDLTQILLILIAIFLLTLIIIAVVTLVSKKKPDYTQASRQPEKTPVVPDDDRLPDTVLGNPVVNQLMNPQNATASGDTQMLPGMQNAVRPKHRVTIFYNSGATEKRMEMSSSRLSIGRASNNDISIPTDNFLGRNHAELVWIGDNLLIRNIDAKNGSFINGRRIDKQAEIMHSCDLKVGATHMKLEWA